MQASKPLAIQRVGMWRAQREEKKTAEERSILRRIRDVRERLRRTVRLRELQDIECYCEKTA